MARKAQSTDAQFSISNTAIVQGLISGIAKITIPDIMKEVDGKTNAHERLQLSNDCKIDISKKPPVLI